VSAPEDLSSNKHLFHISSSDEWYGDILTYLRTQKIGPQLTRDDQHRIHHHAMRYLLIGDVLYCRGSDTLLRQCLSHEEAKRVLNDSHSGECGGQAFGMDTTQKIMCVGYFWPTLFCDCILDVKRCANCHVFSSKMRAPSATLHPVITANPFCKWAIDFMECKPASAGGIITSLSELTTLPNGQRPCPLLTAQL